MQTRGKRSAKAVRAGGERSLRRLPAVSRVIEHRRFSTVQRRWGAALVSDTIRAVLAGLRDEVLAGRLDDQGLARRSSMAALAQEVEQQLTELLSPRPRPVINATGVVVHTNLGRSILSEQAARRLADAAQGYLDLEYDLETGRRGKRFSHLEPLMERLFPGHGFAVFNNNAAAIMVCLRALAARKEVLVSRGELVEIGGSFRVPDIMSASGARLREVGTTNRTRASDYEGALSPKTGALLKVHTSNFSIVGFTEEPTLLQLAEIARSAGLPLIVDWGSGDLLDLGPLGIHDEMPVAQVLAAGADLVTFSGDKLLGGPQVGFVVGRPDLVERVRRDPVARVCRLDRLLVSALHATLCSYVAGKAFDDVPTLRMLAIDADELRKRADKLRRKIANTAALRRRVSVVPGVSRTGGGSSPMGERPTWLVSIASPGGDAAGLERALREGTPPVIARIHEGQLLVDLRTVPVEQEPTLAEQLRAAMSADKE